MEYYCADGVNCTSLDCRRALKHVRCCKQHMLNAYGGSPCLSQHCNHERLRNANLFAYKQVNGCRSIDKKEVMVCLMLMKHRETVDLAHERLQAIKIHSGEISAKFNNHENLIDYTWICQLLLNWEQLTRSAR